MLKVGPEAEIETNSSGGKQSKIPYRCDLLGGRAMLALSSVLYDGAVKYEENNWRQIPRKSHINHAMMHLFAYLAGDKQDEHLEHSFCRLMMAIETE
jgi:hypothetical protein